MGVFDDLGGERGREGIGEGFQARCFSELARVQFQPWCLFVNPCR